MKKKNTAFRGGRVQLYLKLYLTGCGASFVLNFSKKVANSVGKLLQN